jgi:5-methylcytosine-specific restriction endonuclease McrA
MTIDGMKSCRRCRKKKIEELFVLRKDLSGEYEEWCLECDEKDRKHQSTHNLVANPKRRILANIYESKDLRKRASGIRSRAIEYGADDQTVAPVVLREMLERCGYTCMNPNCRSLKDLQFDHVVPHEHGGLTSIYNLQVLCRACNQWKYTKTIDFRPEDWPWNLEQSTSQ